MAGLRSRGRWRLPEQRSPEGLLQLTSWWYVRFGTWDIKVGTEHLAGGLQSRRQGWEEHLRDGGLRLRGVRRRPGAGRLPPCPERTL